MVSVTIVPGLRFMDILFLQVVATDSMTRRFACAICAVPVAVTIVDSKAKRPFIAYNRQSRFAAAAATCRLPPTAFDPGDRQADREAALPMPPIPLSYRYRLLSDSAKGVGHGSLSSFQGSNRLERGGRSCRAIRVGAFEPYRGTKAPSR